MLSKLDMRVTPKSYALVLGIVVSSVLLTGAGVLYTVAGERSQRPYRDCIDLIREIQMLSSYWSAEVARVRTDPLADFDELTAFSARMESLKRALSESADQIPDVSGRLAKAVEVYLSAADAKKEGIERFKTSYAVVRNSTRNLPLAAASVIRQAQEMGEESLVLIIAIVTQDMYLYLTAPTEPVKERLSGVVDEMHDASVGYSPALAAALTNLTTHMAVLLSVQAPMNTLFRNITVDETTEFGNRLIRDVELQLSNASRMTTYFKQGFAAVVVAVVVMFWVLFLIQRHTRTRTEHGETDGRSMVSREAASEG